MQLSYEYDSDSFAAFEEGRAREWALTNGIGGYAGCSLIGAQTRTHQGYLIASLHPPIERYLVFANLYETVTCTQSADSADAQSGDGAGAQGSCILTQSGGTYAKTGGTDAQGSGKSRSYQLAAVQKCENGQIVYEEGQRYLTHFCYDGSVHYTYRAGDVTLKKHITLKQGENVCAVAYEVENDGSDALLALTPFFFPAA